MNLNQWLAHIEENHPCKMDLSLERVQSVAERLGVINNKSTVITVGGTNGKGSCVAGLESIYLTQGYRVGAFTSPFLIKFNEYVRIQGQVVTDSSFCEAFEEIEKVKGHLTLTTFEYTALAAFLIFSKANLDIWLLEVGLGGRFDAVNVIDSDLAIVSSIAIDHAEWLGDTREKIAYEKAGIFRSNSTAICGDKYPPSTLLSHAQEIKTNLYCLDKEYSYNVYTQDWTWRCKDLTLTKLPIPSLSIQNLSTVLMAIHLLQKKCPVELKNIYAGIKNTRLAGRLQVVPGKFNQIWDVAHNPAATALLADWLNDHPVDGIRRAVFSILGDKDISGVLNSIKHSIDEWYVADLNINRSASLSQLETCFKNNQITQIETFDSIQSAYLKAMSVSLPNDRVIVFGSFRTVAAIQNLNR